MYSLAVSLYIHMYILLLSHIKIDKICTNGSKGSPTKRH